MNNYSVFAGNNLLRKSVACYGKDMWPVMGNSIFGICGYVVYVYLTYIHNTYYVVYVYLTALNKTLTVCFTNI